jgi:TonB dependent receptor
LQDQLGGGLSGDDTSMHFNPVIGATYKISSDVTAYAGFSEADRAPNFGAGGASFTDPCSLSPAQPRSVYAGLKAKF